MNGPQDVNKINKLTRSSHTCPVMTGPGSMSIPEAGIAIRHPAKIEGDTEKGL